MKTVVALASVLFVTVAASATAMTFTYELRGSRLDACQIRGVTEAGFDEEFRPCSAAERQRYALPEGQTYDGVIRINEDLLAGGTLRDTVIGFTSDDDPEAAAVEFNLANISGVGDQMSGTSGFFLKTDANRRPLDWYLNSDYAGGGVGVTEFLTGALKDGFPLGEDFGFPSNTAFDRKEFFEYDGDFQLIDYAVVDWHGPGGTLALVPVPAALPLALAGIGALGLAGWRRRRSVGV